MAYIALNVLKVTRLPDHWATLHGRLLTSMIMLVLPPVRTLNKLGAILLASGR